MTYLLKNTEVLGFKLESTAGTAETIADADFNVRVRNIEFSPSVAMDDENSKFATGDHGEDESIPGSQTATISFSVRCSWHGTTPATAPNWWKMVQACGGVTQSYTTAGIAIYPGAAADKTTATIEYMVQRRGATPTAVSYKMKGCMGNCVLTCEGVGMPWMANFTFTGSLASVSDIANANILALTSPSTVVAEKGLDNPVTILGVASQKVSSWSLDFGNDIQPVLDQSDSTGVAYHAIAARRPRLTINPLIRLVATDPIYTKLQAGTEGACSIASASSTPNFTLHVPVGQAINTGVGVREGVQSWDGLTIKCQRNAGTDSDTQDEAGWYFLQKATS